MTANLPDFMTDPNAVLNDTEFEWRYGRVPSYTKVNEAYEQGTRVMFILKHTSLHPVSTIREIHHS